MLQRYGDEEAGFSIAVDEAGSAVRMEGWGFWNAGLATEFGRVSVDACRSARKPWHLFLELGRLRPLREEGQQAFARLVSALPMLGATRAVVVAKSALTRMQLMRIARESIARDLVEFSDDAPAAASAATRR